MFRTSLCPSYGKPEAAAAVDRLPMMGIRMPDTCWAVFKRQAINLYLLVDSFETDELLQQSLNVYIKASLWTPKTEVCSRSSTAW